MFSSEAEGLLAIKRRFEPGAPQIISCGIIGKRQFLVLQWLNRVPADNASLASFGTALAQMHKAAGKAFGWETSNYIGSLSQQNTWCDTWPEFYVSCRILPMARKLYDTGKFSDRDTRVTEDFCKKLDNIFPNELPSFLHGDLWSGNFMITNTLTGSATPVLIDPAIYFGHREMDIAMTKLFGGFGPSFYDGYEAAYPLQKGWQQRIEAAQLCPLLVHAVLFGGSYIRQAVTIIKSYS